MIRNLELEPTPDFGPLIRIIGLKPIIDQVGLKKVLETVGPGQVIAEMGLDWFLSQLTPEQIQELKQRLP